MSRLSLNTLDRLPATVARPRYDVAAVRVGVVHLGVGAFHRAHQAVYLDDRLAAGETQWAICGASLRSPQTSRALDPQDRLYALSVRSEAGEDLRVIGALRQLVGAGEALLAAMSDPAVRIVTLTVTEKGYCHDPAARQLDELHPDIRHDLANPRTPRSAPGFLVEALARRRSAGTAPFAIVSCDNLPSNGVTARAVIARLAQLRDADFGRWVSGEVAFPSTMVDRIVPATTDEDRARIAAGLGVEDAWPVVSEPFSQWVIEDRFPSGRPRFEDSGATLVGDVAPFELAKLRLLNGAHSALAYLGYLAGYETVAEAMADENLAGLVAGLMTQEAAPTLDARATGDLDPYIARLLARFRNPALRHRTWQIAMDGSQKLPQRLLETARARLAAGQPIERLALGVAAWMRYVVGVDEQGRAIDVRDPLAARLKAIAERQGLEATRLAPALAAVGEVFGADLAADPRFLAAVTSALAALIAKGARRTVADYAAVS
ncbi:MAG TPA: mannitol dehydrogenase family protein [Roseiarcus sp.]|nr:mannitol dehydrogenase family protein [Roseiarcus sp.]